jgi:predicted GNAT superfamily acetyltransferase
MKGSSIDIRPLTRIEDISQIEDIQRQTWKMEELDIVPARIFNAMQKNGACLLGAFDGKKVVGFVFGLLGTVEGLDDRIDQVAAARLLMYSVTMGILPEYQRMGIGYRLKVGQREFALRIGVRLITWTFDPLESLNGYLNFQKLGVVCHQYFQNYYGEMSGINVGLPSDRFSVEWWVTSNRVTGRVSQKRGPLTLSQYLGGRALIVNECDVGENFYPIPPAEYLRRESSLIIVEIPDDIQRIKATSPLLAKQWRQHIRSVFDYYFDQEYMVTDFVRHSDEASLSRSYYVLTQAGI